MVFGLFKKIMSLILSGIWVKWKLLWFINILWKLHAWEKSGSQVIAYRLIIRLISDFNCWHVDRREWKKQGSLTGFLEKFSFGEMGHFGTKIAHPDNSGSAGRVFLKWGNKYMRMILIIFQKKSFLGGKWIILG